MSRCGWNRTSLIHSLDSTYLHSAKLSSQLHDFKIWGRINIPLYFRKPSNIPQCITVLFGFMLEGQTYYSFY